MNKTTNKLWAGVLYVWNHPIILAPILLILAYLLFNEIRTQAFTSYMNCNYVLGDGIKFNATVPLTSVTWTSVFCDGFYLGVRPVGFDVPGLGGVLNTLLEFVRMVSVWAVLLFFAFMSFLLTQIINNLKTIIKILTLDREEWKRFGSSIFTFLLMFVVLCTLFYFNVMHPDFLNITTPGH